MVTELDKTIGAILAALAVWLNQKYGFTLPVDPSTMALVVGGIITAVVYLVPNKKAS